MTVLLVIQDHRVVAVHRPTQIAEITLDLYPGANAIKLVAVPAGLEPTVGQTDPTLEHPDWLVGDAADDMPVIYAVLEFSGGDGKDPVGLKLGHATKGTMAITGELRAVPDIAGSLPVSIAYAWRITIRKVVSEYVTTPIGSASIDGITVAENRLSWQVDGIEAAFDPEQVGLDPGVYQINDADFAPVSGAAFSLPSDYRVELVGGPKFFKVLK